MLSQLYPVDVNTNITSWIAVIVLVLVSLAVLAVAGLFAFTIVRNKLRDRKDRKALSRRFKP